MRCQAGKVLTNPSKALSDFVGVDYQSEAGDPHLGPE